MVDIKGGGDLAKKAHDQADKDPKPTQLPADGPKANAAGKGQDRDDAKNRDGQNKVRLARPDEEARIKRERRTGDWKNMARDQDEIERCRSAKDLETHTRLARPDEEDEIKERHAKKRAEAAGVTAKPRSTKEAEADAAEAAASVARRQALGGV